jgi:uncharacterized membrane protein
MKMKESPLPWWGYVFVVLGMLVAGLAYPHLPERIATHYASDLRPNAFMPKGMGLAVPVAAMVAFAGLWHVLWRVDPRRDRYFEFWPTYRTLGGLLQGFLFVMLAWMIGRNLHTALASPSVLPVAVGVLLILVANLLPRLEPNWWAGVRTPWTLSDEEVWRRTHRLAGEAGVPVGAVLVAAGLALPASASALLTIILVLAWAGFGVGASYALYRRRQRS